MAKKPTEKQLYKLKNEWLGQFFEEVKPKEFYRAVFPEGSFERKGHFEDGKANGILTAPTGKPVGAVRFVLQMCKNSLIRLAVKRSKGQYII